jgi:hypothetical protein
MSEQNKNDVPMIPEHKAESMLMHMGRANRNIAIVSVALGLIMLLMAYIFVTGYTSRTKDWLNTLSTLQSKIAEVEDGHKADP